MLRTKFKNLRRPSRASSSGIVVEPPQKKLKTTSITHVAKSSESDIAEYTRHVEYLRQTYESKKWSLSGMKILLEETSKQRRSWVETDCPAVKEILDVFPCFVDPRIVSEVFELKIQ